MKKYNLSSIMKTAWGFFRKGVQGHTRPRFSPIRCIFVRFAG